MRRGLFSSFFVCIVFAMALAAALGHWFVPHGWMAAAIFILIWAGASAFLLARSLRRDISAISTSAIIAERSTEPVGSRYADFDELVHAIAARSEHVKRVLADAAAGQHELEAMIDSMQDSIVAVDEAGRIQWANQCMQRLIPGVVTGGAVRVGHTLVQTIRDPEVLQCVRAALGGRGVSER